MDGHKITALRKQRGCLYTVELADGTVVSLDRRTVDEAGVREGTVLSEAEWDALCARSDANRARERALWLLSRRDHSRRELEQKLRGTVGREQAEVTAARMEEVGLVDDSRYAERLARDLCLVRKLPMRRAEQKMAEKGLSREDIRSAIENLGVDDVRQALAHLEKMCYTDANDEETRRKMREKLIRIGFSYDTVRSAVRLIEEGDW